MVMTFFEFTQQIFSYIPSDFMSYLYIIAMFALFHFMYKKVSHDG